MYAPEVILHSTLKVLILRIVTGKSELWATFGSRTRLVEPSKLPRELAGRKSIGRLHLIEQRRVLRGVRNCMCQNLDIFQDYI